MQPKKVKTSAGLETVDETVNRATKLVDNSANQTISSASLAPQPKTKVQSEQATPSSTLATGMMAEFEDSTDSYTKNLEAQAQSTEKVKNTALDDYLSGLNNAQGTTALTADAYSVAGGVDSITPELNDINDKIRREQLSLRRRTEAIQEKGGGLASGANAEIGNLERESFAKQADLSIIQMAVQGRYDSAKEIADRAVSAKLEQQQNKLDILRFNYEENKELFTKAEQRKFESDQADRERKLEEEKENATAIYDLGLQAQLDGAPSAVVQRMFQAKTKEEAMAIGGSYIGALDRENKRLQNQNLREQISERANSGNPNGTLNGKAQTAAQASANGFADRLVEASEVFDSVESMFTGTFAYGGLLPNALQSKERQQFEQAKKNFVNAVLRRESGAAISPTEFDNAALQYFAQPGDSAEVLAQKAENRNTVINNLYREANAFRPVKAGDVIESDGIKYRVEEDGQTITPLE